MLRTIFSSLFISLTLFVSFSVPSLSAADYNLGEILVEAPAWRYPQEITGAPDSEMYFENRQTTGQTTLPQALNGQMDLNVRTSGGAGHIAALSSSGLSGNKILVVKDGLPINDPFTGSPDISDFSVMQFDKAQFWQGNRATLWGSNSIGGTLRLTSRFPDYGRLRLWTDGFGGHGQAIETSIHPSSAKLGIRLSQFFTPGFSAASLKNGNAERDSFALNTAYLAFATNPLKRFQIQFSADYSESMTDLDSFDFVSGLPTDSHTFRQKKQRNQFNIGFKHKLQDGVLKFAHVFGNTALTGLDENNAFNEYGLTTKRQRQSISRTWISKQRNLLLDISRQETKAENLGFFSVRETDRAMVLASEEKLSPSLVLNAAWRHDRPQNHVQVNTGNIGLRKELKDFHIALAWGQSFRMPSLNERYYPGYGSPNLSAEHSTSARLSIGRYLEGSGKVELSAISYRVRDLIGTSATTDPAYTWGIKSANLNQAEIMTQQISISDAKLGELAISANYKRMHKFKLLNTGLKIPGIARHSGSLCLAAKFCGLSLNTLSTWRGTTWENAENTKRVGPTNEVSLFIKKQFKECALEVAILNMTNNTDERVIGYTHPGRHLTLAFES